MTSAALDDRVKDCAAFTPIGITEKQPILLSKYELLQARFPERVKRLHLKDPRSQWTRSISSPRLVSAIALFLGTLAYTFARIDTLVRLKVEDYYPSWKRFLLRFKEKGGKKKELPVHHKLEELLDEYLQATGLGAEPGSLLFPAAVRKTGK